MRALKITDKVELVDLRYNEFSVTAELKCRRSIDLDIILMRDGVIYHNLAAKAEGKMRNDLASLIAGAEVYGTAIIAGIGGDDVPQQYVDAYLT